LAQGSHPRVLSVQPDVFRAIAVVEAVDHDRERLIRGCPEIPPRLSNMIGRALSSVACTRLTGDYNNRSEILSSAPRRPAPGSHDRSTY